MPKVSVIIPTCNRPDLIRKAVNSILGQSFQDFEIIIVDDGLEKRAKSEVEKINDHRIRYIQHKENKGGAVARNTGIKEAKGDFIAFLDDDDEWSKDKLKKQVEALEENKNVGVVFCGVEIYNKKGEKISNKIFIKEGIVNPFVDLLHKCFIWTSSFMYRRELSRQGYMFDVSFTKNQEWDLLLRLAKITDFFSIKEALVRINIDDEKNIIEGKGNIQELYLKKGFNIIRGFERLVEKHYDDYKQYPKSLSLRYFQLGLLNKNSKNDSESFKYFLKAWRNNPFNLVYLKYLLLSFVNMQSIIKIYKRLKKVPVLGLILIFIRNIPNQKIFLLPRLKRQDFKEAVKVGEDIFGNKAGVKTFLKEFKKNDVFKNKFSFGHAGDFDVLILYILTRIIKPEIVVETGVASGRSSAAILLALHENKKGKLHSIDLPQYYEGNKPESYITHEGNSELRGFVPEGKKPGWIVSDFLRDRWDLILGDSKVELPKLLETLESVDIFYHDSDHSYESMIFEFESSWSKIKEDGFLVSDDIKWNSSFDDFSKKINKKFLHIYRNLGIIRK